MIRSVSIIFILSISLYGQEGNVRFEYLSRTQGLSNPEIYSLLQDRTGYLWVGTTDGLNRYDGYTFKHYMHQPFNENSITESFIFALTEDREGNIWAGTAAGGINRIDPRKNTITRFRRSEHGIGGLPDDHIRSLFADRSNVLWIGTIANGVVRCDLSTMEFQNITSIKTRGGIHTLSVVRSVTEDVHGTIWFGTNRNEIIRYDHKNNTGEVFSVPYPSKEPAVTFNTIYPDTNGVLWFGTSKGEVISFDPQTTNVTVHPVPVQLPDPKKRITVSSIIPDRSGQLWIASSYGIFTFSKQSKRFHCVTRGIQQNYSANRLTRTLLIDRSDVLWAGTFIDGLIKIITLPKEIVNLTHADGMASDYVRGLFIDKKNTIWIGTTNGLSVYHPQSGRCTPLNNFSYILYGEPTQNITSICGDDRGAIWYGTMNGVYKYLPETKRTIHVTGTGSPLDDTLDNYVYEVRSENDGSVWVSTDGGGLIKLDNNGKIIQRYSKADKSLPVNSVRTVVPDTGNILWVGTFGGGLCRLHLPSRTFTSYGYVRGDSSSLSNDLVLSLLKDSRNTLWVGTRTGLNKFDPVRGTFKHFFTSDGLPNDLIVGILEDHSTHLWISTYYGLSKFDGVHFQNYFNSDGFQDDFNSGASMKDRTGRMYFGGGTGLCMFTPEELTIPQFIPPIVIEGMKPTDRTSSVEVRPGDQAEITLSPSERTIEFNFAKLDFRNPEANLYAYQLQGFEPEWIYSGTRRNVSYTNLNGGEYSFRVKAQGRDGVWREAGSGIRLSVIPPIFERWWFYPLILVLISSTAAAFYRSWIMRRLAVERIRTNLAADPHDEIGSGLARIAVLSDILDQQTHRRPKSGTRPAPGKEDRSSLRIGVISRELMESISDVVWSIDPRNDRSEQLIERINTYVTEVCEEAGIELNFSADELNDVQLEPFMKRALLLIVKEGMNNIVKHSQAKHVIIHLKRNRGNIVLAVRDDGIGFLESALGRVNGLNNMRTRAEQSGGIINIYSAPGKGTFVESSFPL